MWKNIDKDRHYIGDFIINGEQFSGELIYNKKNGGMYLWLQIRVEVIGRDFNKFSRITGKLHSGDLVTLFNNRCVMNHTHLLSYQQVCFSPEYIVWSREESIERKYNELELTLENALLWSGLSRINGRDPSSLTVAHKDESNEYTWFNARITFSTRIENECCNLPRKEVCVITERLVINIKSDDKKDISFFTNVRDNILALISFAIKDNVNIEDQTLYDYDSTYSIGKESGQTRNIEYKLLSSDEMRNIREPNVYEYNFTLSDLNCNDKLMNLEKLMPVFKAYAVLFKYRDMPSEMIFLNLVQALETYHSRFCFDDKKEYINYVETKFGSPPPDNIRQLLLCDTQMDKNCGYIILYSRLNDLLIGNFDGLFSDYYDVDKTYAQKIADTRHYYVHYSKSKESKALRGYDLGEAINVLGLLLEYNVCSKLGVDIREKVANRLNNISISRKFYENQYKSD